MCTGNADDSFVSILRDKGGVIKRGEAVTAYLDVNCNCVRRNDCHIIMKESGMCKQCKQYRPTLRAMKSRSQNHTHASSLSHDSHTNYRYLEPDDLVERLRNVQAQRRRHN